MRSVIFKTPNILYKIRTDDRNLTLTRTEKQQIQRKNYVPKLDIQS
jgi:hypothetical protein